MSKIFKIFCLIFFVSHGYASIAQNNFVEIEVIGDHRCISSNGSPNHAIGQFPNRGNPNRFKSQNVKICVNAHPSITGIIDQRASGSGITITGIFLRPGTADWYDASSPRGFSRDRSSGWNLEGMRPKNTLGLDRENAHVASRGLYHYHGVSTPLVNSLSGILLGYVVDGYEIHYIGKKA